MLNDAPSANGTASKGHGNPGATNFNIKAGLAQMLKGGVIMDVVNAEQVKEYHNIVTQLTYTDAFVNPGPNSRRSRCLRCHGPRTSSCRYPSPRWRCPYVRPSDDPRNYGHSLHTRNGQSTDRSLRRMPGMILTGPSISFYKVLC